jgi:hypothetical protein
MCKVKLAREEAFCNMLATAKYLHTKPSMAECGQCLRAGFVVSAAAILPLLVAAGTILPVRATVHFRLAYLRIAARVKTGHLMA